VESFLIFAIILYEGNKIRIKLIIGSAESAVKTLETAVEVASTLPQKIFQISQVFFAFRWRTANKGKK
jgi:hypothetical protein